MDIEKVVFHALTQFLALAQKEAIPVSYTHLQGHLHEIPKQSGSQAEER